MQTMVSLSVVQAGVFAFLACLCAATYIGLRNQPSLAWLAAALSCGAVGILLVWYAKGTYTQWIAITIVAPSAYLCVGQCVRALLSQKEQYRALIGAVVGLTLLAVLLALAGTPFLYQTLPWQLACALAIFETVLRLARAPHRQVLDICLIVTLTGLALIFLVRIPVFLILFDPGSGYSVLKISAFQRGSLVISAILGPATAFLLLARVISGVISTYRMRSERDGLTGLLNRHAFDQAVASEGRGGGALILCDIDHFKRVNDRYGHAVGDDVLCAFAGLLQHSGYRSGRMGGEEFALLLPRSSAAEAVGIADMIRERFHAGTYPGVAADHRLSASFGIAEYSAGMEPKTAFVRADGALYRAKEGGRNRIMTADAETDTRLRAA